MTPLSPTQNMNLKPTGFNTQHTWVLLLTTFIHLWLQCSQAAQLQHFILWGKDPSLSPPLESMSNVKFCVSLPIMVPGNRLSLFAHTHGSPVIRIPQKPSQHFQTAEVEPSFYSPDLVEPESPAALSTEMFHTYNQRIVYTGDLQAHNNPRTGFLLQHKIYHKSLNSHYGI